MERSVRVKWVSTVLAVALLLVCRTSPAKINPNFTPKDVAEQSDLIIVGPLQAGGRNPEWTLTVARQLKGKGAAKHVVSLVGCNKDHAGDIREILKENAAEPVILFAGTMEEQKRAYMHVAGTWLGIRANGESRWNVTGYAATMSETYAGGTDMLIRMSEYMVKHPDPDVPVSAGVRWADERLPVGKITGRSAGMAPVEIGKQRTLHLFVASTDGDKLFRAKTVDLETSFKDVTAACGLDTRSRRFAWVDVNRDGLSDLVTWDGTSLSLRLAGKDGKFKAAGAEWSRRLEAGCTGIAACSTDGGPGVLLGTHRGPVMLAAKGKKGWSLVSLPGSGTGEEPSSPCVVADLDGDGRVDVLQPGVESGLLWNGRAKGFGKPAKTAVAAGPGAAKAAVGDFNQDGALDIFLSGAQRNSLWENDGRGRFKNVFERGGSISYKCPPRAAEVRAMDLNHDGRQDLCFVYPAQGIVYHFNRGFRAFGEEGEVRLPGLEGKPGRAVGQLAMAVADFDGAGSQDLVVLVTTGEICCYTNDQMDMPGLRLRLAKGVTGPITVSCWQGEKFPVCVGSVAVAGHSPPSYVSAQVAGPVTIRWCIPGKGAQVKKVIAEDGLVDVEVAPDKPKAGK